jgi:hypothetical protein
MPFFHPVPAAISARNVQEILFFGGGIALLLAAAFLAPHRGARWFRGFENGLARIARHRGLAILGVALFALGIAVALALTIGLPQPKVDDEFSYLLAADTFAHGRLANPPHPLWQHFETFHVIQQPAYASKYPPGQGLILALGQFLSHPVVGVWLSTAMACAAITWMLMAWLPARWGLLGGLLAAMHPEVLIWSQRYWGGSLTLAAGALALGGFRRLLRKPCARDAVLMTAGMAATIVCRPYEGGVMTMILLVALAFLIGVRKCLAPRIAFPIAIGLAMTGAWTGYYNWRVTGSPTRMPYQVHSSAYMAAPIFVWQSAPPLPAYRHAELRDFHTGWEYRGYARQQSAAGLATGLLERTWRLLRSHSRLWFLSLSLVALPWALRRDRWMRRATWIWLLFTAALLQVNWTFFHYAAPVFGLFFVLVIQSMRHLRLWHWHGKSVGLFLARGSVILCAVSVLQSWREIASQYQDRWWAQREEVVRRVRQDGGKHLIVVRDAPGIAAAPGFRDWVRNLADLDGPEIVWARAMEAMQDRQLLDYYKDRRAWLLEVGRDDVRLLPYPR